MPRYNRKACEDEDDARRMCESIMRFMGYNDVATGRNDRDVQGELSAQALIYIARNAERIARWAREEEKRVRGRGLDALPGTTSPQKSTTVR